MNRYICNRCGHIQIESSQCRYCLWGDMYQCYPEPAPKVDRDYDADFVAGTRWYDYVLSGALVAAIYPFAAMGRLARAVKNLLKK